MRRINRYFRRVFTLDEFRARLAGQLGITANSAQAADLPLEKARFFVARGHGFESWAELVDKPGVILPRSALRLTRG
jgi:hypothetical protein